MAAKKKQDDEVQVTTPAPEQPANNTPLQGGDGTDTGQQPTITVEVDAPTLANITPARVAPLDKTIPGGRYVVNGRLVNCNGEPIEE